MTTNVAHDPFARGSYRRTNTGPGKCGWCGNHCERLYHYVWEPDDRTHPTHGSPGPNGFCNLGCFRSYYS